MLSAVKPKAEADNTYLVLDYFLIHCFEGKTKNISSKEPELILLLEIMHCARNLQISQLSASR